MTGLIEIRSYSSELESDKITARKKAEDSISVLLNNPRIIKKLDEDSIRGGSFTWTDLWRATYRYTDKEATKWIKDLEKVTANKAHTHHGKKAFVTNLMKVVLQKCNKSLIKPDVLVDNLLSFLASTSTCIRIRQHFGADVVDVILKRVLSSSRYNKGFRIGEASVSNQWKTMLTTAFDLFKSSTIEGLTLQTSCEFLLKVIEQSNIYSSCWQMVLRRFNIFLEILDLDKLQKSSTDTKIVALRLVNLVQDILKRESRQMLCKLGEKSANSVMALFEEGKTDKEVIKFFRFQMSLHHPQGAKSITDGAFFLDEEAWKEVLPRIYANLIDTLIANKKRQNRHKGTKNYSLDPEVVELAAQVGQQLFNNTSENTQVNLTQIVPMEVTQTQPPNKRRKLDMTLQVCILDKLKRKSGEEEEVITPWLQILSNLIPKLDEENLANLGNLLLDRMQYCRTPTVKSLLLKCYQSYLNSRRVENWALFWEDCINTIKLNQCIEESHSLIQSMMELGLCKDLDLLFELYDNKRIKISASSLRTLSMVLKMKPQNAEKRKNALIWVTEHESLSVFLKHSPRIAIRLLITMMVHPYHVSNISFEDCIQTKESHFEELERKTLESNQILLSLHQKSSIVSTKRLVLCDQLKTSVKDCIIQQCGVILDALVKNPQKFDSFEAVLDYSHFVGSLLDTEVGKLVKDRRLENVAISLQSKCASILAQLLKDTKKSVVKALTVMPFLTAWTNFLQGNKLLGDDGIIEVNKAIYEVIKNLCKSPNDGMNGHKSRENSNDGFISSDDEDDTATNGDKMDVDDDDDDETKSMLPKLIKQCWTAIGYGIALSSDDFEDFVDSLKGLADRDEAKTAFYAIEAFLETTKDKRLKLGLLPVLQKLIRSFCSMTALDPYLMRIELKCLKSSIDLLASNEISHDQEKSNVLKFAMGLIKIQGSFQRFSREVEIGFIDFLSKLAQCDPNGNWASFNSKWYGFCSHNDERMDSVDEDSNNFTLILTKYSRNPSQVVRDFAIHQMNQLNLSPEVCRHLYNSMESWSYVPSPDDIENGIAKDIKANLLGSKLSILLSLLLTKSGDRLSLMKRILRIYVRDSLPIQRLKSVVKTLCSPKGLNTEPTEFLTPLLEHLMLDCLKISKLESFPFGLYQNTFASFIKTYEKVIAPLLIWHHQCDSLVISKLVKATNKKEKQLFTDNFVALASIYLPDLTNPKCDQLYKAMTQILGEAKHNELLNTSFPEIFGRVLKRIEDPRHLHQVFGIQQTGSLDLVYPGLTLSKFQKFANEMHSHMEDSDQGFWTTLSEMNPDTLQKLMSEVCRPLKSSSVLDQDEAVLSSLHGLFIVIEMIRNEFDRKPQGLAKKVPYVTWYVISTLTSLLKETSENQRNIVLVTLAILPKLVQFHAVLDKDWTAQECVMSRLVQPLINALIGTFLNHEGTNIAQDALDIMKMIVLDNKRKLATDNYVRLLGPFPKGRECFKELLEVTNGELNLVMDKEESVNLSKNLVDEMKDFVRINHHTVETVNVLLAKIKESTEQFSVMVKTMPTVEFSEDANQSLLHQVVKSLILLSRTGVENVKLLAHECLGHLGPLDLSTMTLFSGEIMNGNEALIKELLDLVTNKDSKISDAAIFALKRVMSSKIDRKSIAGHQLRHFLYPFEDALVQTTPKTSVSLVKEDLNNAIRCSKWWPDCEHAKWISEIVDNLLHAYPHVKDGYLSKASIFGRHLVDMAKLSSVFCGKVFPWLIHDIMKTVECPDVSISICSFFDKFYRLKEVKDQNCLVTMLNVVKYLRMQSRNLSTKWEDNFWIQGANYLHIAYAAFSCQEYVDVVLYCDIWCREMLSKCNKEDEFSVECLSKSLLDILYESSSNGALEDVKMCQNLMAQAFMALGEKNAIQGCGSNRILDFNAQIQQLMRDGEHAKAMAMYDSQLSLDNRHKDHQMGLLRAMHEASLEHTLQQFQKNCHQSLQSWDSELDEAKDLLLKRSDGFGDKIKAISLDVGAQQGHHLMSNVYDSLSKWKILQEMKVISQAMDIETHQSTVDIFHRGLLPIMNQDYNQVKSILVNRCSLLSALPFLKLDEASHSPHKHRMTKLNEIKKTSLLAFVDNSMQLCSLGRLNEDFNLVYKQLSLVDHIKSECKGPLINEEDWQCIQDSVDYQKSLLFWAWGEKDTAKMQLKHLIKKLTVSKSELLPEAIGVMGSWLWTLRSESAYSILENYYKRSVALFEEQLDKVEKAKAIDKSLKMAQDIAEAYNKLGTFCDEQYMHVLNYMNSKDFEDQQALLEQISQDHQMRKTQGIDKGEARTTSVIMERNSMMDKKELGARLDEKLTYLMLALENYAKALTKSDKHDVKIYRWISLWFSNMEEDKVNNLVGHYTDLIPDYKFVGLMYQLCARMVTKKESRFARILSNLIVKCAIKHPYHTLPIVLALANSNADEKFQENKKKISLDEENDRSKAAREIVTKLKNQNSLLSEVVNKTETMSLALIQLAYTAPPDKNKEKHSISSHQPLLKLKNMENVLLPTHTLNIDKSGNYLGEEGFCGLSRFESSYSMVGGINAPKKISCIGTDGKARPQLLKGKDDLRQDAVMQQVFGLMNNLLRTSTSDKLQIRTFKVVPLSQRSGILEWCVNTEPISEFLVGSDRASGAHKKYHPQDWTAKKCLNEMRIIAEKIMELKKKKKGTEADYRGIKVDKFIEICHNFKPVFRHFFYENFNTSYSLLERRLAYTRSCATSSMIGYILGLGDRHVHNILIDKHTAEVIHIDLGIAFEQGKILPTPETVPFRLTRDIIDGFGPCGVEGTFRKCAETTLKVLRANKESILTILEVLMFDPLYNWSLTPAKAYKLQFGREPGPALRKQWETEKAKVGGNKLAERALLRVTQKLNGMEEGSHLSVQGQVTSLIQQASDPQNLALVYQGWQPYL